MLRPRASGPASGLYYRGAYAALDFASRIYELDDASYTSGGLTTVPGFTFTGDSLRTMFDSTGAMTYGPNNLCLQSQTFGAAPWSIVRATITADAIAAPDGTLTADKLVEDTSTNTHYARQTVTAPIGQSLPSIYIKAAGRTWAFVEFISGATDRYAYINLTTGAVGTGTATPTVTDAGNGWWRVSLPVASLAATTQIFVFLASANGTIIYTGDGTSGIYLWGAQLEAVTYRTTPSTYYPTTSAAYYGPRLVYDPVTLASLGILVEEARTNLCLQSQTFDNASWTKQGVSITANALTSPDGTANADKLVEDTSTGDHRTYQAVTLATGTVYTASGYFKAGERTRVQIVCVSVFLVDAYFDLSNGTIISNAVGTAKITAVGGGWYRCEVYGAATASAGSGNVQFRMVSTGTTTSYTGDGTSGLYLFQADVQAGTGASSPIPTTTAAVTRAADVPYTAGLATLAEFTVVAEGIPNSPNVMPTVQTLCAYDDGTTANRIYASRSTSGAANLVSSTGWNATSAATWVQAESRKVAFTSKAGAQTGALTGVLVTPGTSAQPANLSSLSIGIRSDRATQQWNGTIARIRIYNRALNDAQLQALTA